MKEEFDDMLRLISVDVDARKLFCTNTYGLILSCEVKGEEGEGEY